MSEAINPEAAQPSSTQAFERSDRNPLVRSWGETESEGGQVAHAGVFGKRMTQAVQHLTHAS